MVQRCIIKYTVYNDFFKAVFRLGTLAATLFCVEIISQQSSVCTILFQHTRKGIVTGADCRLTYSSE